MVLKITEEDPIDPTRYRKIVTERFGEGWGNIFDSMAEEFKKNPGKYFSKTINRMYKDSTYD